VTQRLGRELLQFLKFGLLAGGDGGSDFIQKLIDGFRRSGHAPADDEIGKTRQIEQAGHFLAQGNRFLEEIEILRRAAIIEGKLEALARRLSDVLGPASLATSEGASSALGTDPNCGEAQVMALAAVDQSA
jgi:hypothetical protein